ncbi:hypothetical protein SAMN05428949_6246 [Chitinophaga sp. YR627]|uniref:TolB family protein n=1 Tax=Chitinophaga sp. YR627 TaxID=1881041 RepID=UPI0008EEF754|nr:hypothetical protein [Chitinophaga sp. YR627]SFO70150.1 hypothetical protein SAMN05428949_6246 [Chitinophaga sp. YR627]
MKKVILGSFALILFSSSILLFQISCQKSADAQAGNGNGSYTLPPATKSALGGVIVGDGLAVSNSGVLSLDPATGGATPLSKIVFSKYNVDKGNEIWLMNYDGTGQTKVNITLPAGVEIDGNAHLSPDGKKLFFVGIDTKATANKDDIYSCDVDGRNLKKIYDMPTSNGHTNLSGVY